MAGKQIIIDGVDVSECNFCEWKSSDIPQCRIRLASFEPTCKGYNCHYKQLKHKEHECETLKKVSCEFKNYCTCNTEKFLQTLDEIKEIAEDCCVFCQKIDPETFDMSECKLCNHSKILQKISEVIN